MKKVIYVLMLLAFASLSNAQWVQVSSGMGSSKSVHSLLYSGNFIYAGTYSNGVYISTNNGDTWTSTSSELSNKQVFSLAISGYNLFAGTSSGLYISGNNGTNWTQTSLNNQSVKALAINGSNVFAGVQNNGVYLSTNNGTSWTQTALTGQTIFTLAINGSLIYAGALMGLYVSADNGTTWYQSAIIMNQDAYSIAISGSNMFVGAYYGVYKTTNNGLNWTLTPLTQNVLALAINGTNILGIARNNGFYVSQNNGTSWTQRNEGLGNLGGNVMGIFNSYIFIGTDASVYRRPLSQVIGIKTISEQVPSSYSLQQNYPNPFNPSSIIRFKIKDSRFVTLIVYDILGKEVATLVNEKLTPGTYEANFNGSNLTSGVYFYRLTTDNFSETKRMILMK
jgi:photosystem II stability/assembly factor-like uncharacterized protein